MKRLLVAAVVVLLATSAFAGVKYQFSSETTGTRAGAGTLSGTASVEGSNFRIDVASGDKMLFKDNSVVISKDGGKTYLILDTKNKTYFELPMEKLLGSLQASGLMQMTIANPQVKVSDGGDGGSVEGYPTHKYVVDSSYDMQIKVLGMKTSTKVQSKTESWTTEKLPIDAQIWLQQKGMKTGIEDLDKLVAAQAKAVKGFPLKHVITSTTTSSNGKSQTSTTTVTVKNIQKVSVPASQFEIPAGYTQTDSPLDALSKIRQ